MKPPVSPTLRQRVIDLHHRHTLRETAAITGLPLGTVKTVCSRSGAFRDNPVHRALFCLPPIRTSAQTLPVAPDLPPQVPVTGDPEVDAVLWLRQIIDTGQADLIERAMTAAKRITTPLKTLEERYTQHLAAANPGNSFAAVFGSLGFADLEGLATRAVKRECLRSEATARFGEALFADTDAELFCIAALAGLESDDRWGRLDEQEVAARFQSRPEVLPHTLTDCLHELIHWQTLYRLRHAVDNRFVDFLPEVHARELFVFGLLAQRRARTRDEALAVFRYLFNSECMDRREAGAILQNLIDPSRT